MGSYNDLFETQELWFSYPEGTQVLRGVSITLQTGELLAIVGPNGAGKTTFVKHLNGLLRPDQGRVLYEGEDIQDHTVAEMAQRVGYVFQNPDHQIFKDTVFEELAFGPRNLGLPESVIKERVGSVSETFRLNDFANASPALLSFGLRRLISIASVLIMEPKVLILDEPTKGLDARLTLKLMQIIHRYIDENRAIVLISHDMALVAEHASRCVVMHDGEVHGDATPREIFTKNDRWMELGVDTPQVTQLAEALKLSQTVLTVDEFCQEALAWITLGGGGDASRE